MRPRRAATALLLLLAAAALPATAAGPARAAPAGPRPLPLSALFDNRAVSDDARPDAADFDGAGRSLSAQDLAAAGWAPGSVLTLDGARLALPRTAAGAPDNVVARGQQVALRGRGEALTFLVAGTGGAATGTGTVRYRDGSRGGYELTAPDWRSGPLGTKAVALPHLNNATGGQSAATARLYAVTVPLRAERAVRSVVLPTASGAGALHVFAVAVRDTGRGRTGSWAASTAGYRAVGPWTDRTLRLVVHSGAGGPRARIRLANTFAAAPVKIAAASIAVRGAGATAERTPIPLTFGGGPHRGPGPGGGRGVQRSGCRI
ncbi:hypothetical protein [Streptomyces sp. NBC_01456]|uniref:hypothetical protein n=1 Tax=unclassified Streptomyces TaxID=2593676 RepID=UPI003FCC7D5A